MSKEPLPTASRPRLSARVFALLIALLTAASMLGTSAISILPTLAPEVARTYGIPAVWVGYQFSLTSACMAVSLLFLGAASRRWGPCRVIQIGMSLVGVALALILIPHVTALIGAAVVMGFGYGLIMPANSHLMMRFSARSNLNMVFSIQQTGIPLGAILAATVAPLIAVAIGWRWAVLALAILVFLLVPLVQFQRHVWDDDRDQRARMPRNPFAGAAIAFANARLRNLSIAGFCFSGAQFCVGTYTVVALVEQLGPDAFAFTARGDRFPVVLRLVCGSLRRQYRGACVAGCRTGDFRLGELLARCKLAVRVDLYPVCRLRRHDGRLAGRIPRRGSASMSARASFDRHLRVAALHQWRQNPHAPRVRSYPGADTKLCHRVWHHGRARYRRLLCAAVGAANTRNKNG
jgi:MFS family permease